VLPNAASLIDAGLLPAEGTYLINPMSVNMPANVEDDDIGKPQDGHSLPENVPTRMSCSIQRLKLAILCREIVDKTGTEYFPGLDVDYDKIMDLDRKLNRA
jgi:hypothetical protein